MKIFHHNDMDGRSSAAIIATNLWLSSCKKLQYGEQALTANELQTTAEYETRSVFVECDYGSHAINPAMVEEGEDVIIVDLSFSQKTASVLEEICKKAKSVVWLDHHLTSQRSIEAEIFSGIENLTCQIDMSESGAAIAWRYMFPNIKIPQFVQYVSDYDTWKHEFENSSFLKLGVDMNPSDPASDIWTSMIGDALFESGFDGLPDDFRRSNILIRLINDGKIAKRYIDSSNTYCYNLQHFVSDKFGVPCDCINRVSNSWIFGSNYSKYPLHCVFAFNGKVWTYSLYSDNADIDCSAIAEKFGGGGHKGAAGFSTQHCLFEND